MNIFKTKPYLTKQCGEFRFDFYYTEGKLEKTYLEISTTSGIFSLRLAGNTYTYGYLLAAAQKDLTAQLQGYAVTLYIPAMGITQDQGLCNDVQKAIAKWQKREEKKAETAAKAVSEVQEQADAALMSEVAAYADATPNERKKMRKESREAMREILNEDNENGQ